MILHDITNSFEIPGAWISSSKIDVHHQNCGSDQEIMVDMTDEFCKGDFTIVKRF